MGAGALKCCITAKQGAYKQKQGNAPVEQKVNVSEMSQISNENKEKKEELKQKEARDLLNKQSRSRHIVVQKQNFTKADQKTMSTQDKLKNTISQEKFLKEREEEEHEL